MNAMINTQKSISSFTRADNIKEGNKAFKQTLMGSSEGLDSMVNLTQVKSDRQINDILKKDYTWVIGARAVAPLTSLIFVFPVLLSGMIGNDAHIVFKALILAVSVGFLIAVEHIKTKATEKAVNIYVQNSSQKSKSKKVFNFPAYIAGFFIAILVSVSMIGSVARYHDSKNNIDTDSIIEKVKSTTAYKDQLADSKDLSKDKETRMFATMKLNSLKEEAVASAQSSLLSDVLEFLLITILAEFISSIPQIFRYSELTQLPLKTRRTLLSSIERNKNEFVKNTDTEVKARQDKINQKIRDRLNLDDNLINDPTDLREIVTKMFDGGNRSPHLEGRKGKLKGLAKLTNNSSKYEIAKKLVHNNLVITGKFVKDKSGQSYVPIYDLVGTINYLQERGIID